MWLLKEKQKFYYKICVNFFNMNEYLEIKLVHWNKLHWNKFNSFLKSNTDLYHRMASSNSKWLEILY